MKSLLRIFGFIVWIYLVANGFSFIVRQKGFDLIAYLFYPEQYLDIRVLDLTEAPYEASLFMSSLYLILPVYTVFWLWANKKDKKGN